MTLWGYKLVFALKFSQNWSFCPEGEIQKALKTCDKQKARFSSTFWSINTQGLRLFCPLVARPQSESQVNVLTLESHIKIKIVTQKFSLSFARIFVFLFCQMQPLSHTVVLLPHIKLVLVVNDIVVGCPLLHCHCTCTRRHRCVPLSVYVESYPSLHWQYVLQGHPL